MTKRINYCSDECRGLAKKENLRLRANEKYGEGWDDDRPCTTPWCDEPISMKGREGMSPYAYLRMDYHSISCSKFHNAVMKKAGNMDENINKAVAAMKLSQEKLKAKEASLRTSRILKEYIRVTC